MGVEERAGNEQSGSSEIDPALILLIGPADFFTDQGGAALDGWLFVPVADNFTQCIHDTLSYAFLFGRTLTRRSAACKVFSAGAK